MRKLCGLFSIALVAGGCASRASVSPVERREMVVIVNVADVRAKPSSRGPRYEYDPDQETQVIRGERVFVGEQKGAWTRVECPEQPEFTHSGKWEGYPGWMRTDALGPDDGSAPRPQEMALPDKSLRAFILQRAESHVNAPYLWGGRSLHNGAEKATLTGVDCSGLVSWSFRQAGRVVPRDAHEQFMKARAVSPFAMKPGDLIFIAKAEKPDRIVHVMFYAGDGYLLEAPSSGERVRKAKIMDRFGKKIEDLKNGEAVDGRILHFGSLLGGK